MKNFSLLCLLMTISCGAPRGSQPNPVASATDMVAAPTSVDPQMGPADRAAFKVVGYFPTWSGDVNVIPYQRLTHINYSFVIPTADGNVTALDDPNRLHTLVQRAHAAHVKVLIAVGGWNDGDESGFRAVAGNEKIRQNFVQNLMNFVQTYQLDGIDIDWEYPDGAEVPGYNAMMSELSTRLHAQNKLLTAAVTANDWPRSIDETVIKAVDFLNIMIYDMGFPHSTLEAAREALVHWKDKEALPKEKFVLGLPFYSSAKGYSTYKDIIAQYGSAAASSDTANDGLDYNGQPTVKAKTQLALQNAAGVMIWEISQDTQDETSLLKTIADEVSKAAPWWGR